MRGRPAGDTHVPYSRLGGTYGGLSAGGLLVRASERLGSKGLAWQRP